VTPMMKKTKRILLIITGHTIDPVRAKLLNTDDHFGALTNGASLIPYAVCEDAKAPSLAEFSGVIMTGSAAMLADNSPWMNTAKDLVKQCLDEEIPFLGVCFGHQMLGSVCGAAVGPNPKGRNNGTCLVEVENESPLFAGIPKTFYAQISHRDVVLERRPIFAVTARTSHDPHHSIQVGKNAFGVQFHPEWNMDISKAYIDAREQLLGTQTASKMRESLRPSPHASIVVQNFVALCR